MKLIPVHDDSVSPVLGTLEAILSGKPGDVLIIDHGGRTDVNSFGGIAAFTALTQGLVGVVIDGVTRDVDEMRSLEFAVYGKGVIQKSIRNRCAFAGHGIQVQLSCVPVNPGDLIMSDENGVIVVPQKKSCEVLEIARELAKMEERLKKDISQGVNPIEAHRMVNYDHMTSH